MKLTTFLISKIKKICAETLTALETAFEIKPMLLWINVALNRNFDYVSSYLQTKVFTRKRDCTISSKLQILKLWSRSCYKAPTSFYRCQ